MSRLRRVSSTTCSALRSCARFELSTRPDNKLGTDEEWDFTEGALRAALDRRGLPYKVMRGRGRLLRAEDRPAHERLARPRLADGNDPARRAAARAARLPLHRRRQRRTHPVRDPPGALRLVRALHRDPDRALRAARSRSGSRPSRSGSSRSARATARRRTSSPRRSRPYRVEVDESDDTVGKRIRNGELAKIPYVVVYGDKESRRVARDPGARRRAEHPLPG